MDNVEVFAQGGPNLVANPDFEAGFSGWFPQGTHDLSSWQTSGGFDGGKCLHIVASGRGDTGANRVRADLASALSPGTTVTLRAKVRWLKGDPNILLRVRGNWAEAPGYILTAKNLGTPGSPNSRAVPNAGPAITGVRHDPCLLDVFIAAVRFMDGGPKKPWWKFTAGRQRALAARSNGSR